MTRQETKRAISDISRAVNKAMSQKGLLNPAQIRVLLKSKKQLQKDLAGWLDGDQPSKLSEF